MNNCIKTSCTRNMLMTTASKIAAAASRKPRPRTAPSSRDQQIYLEYQTAGKLQSELATQYGLTQCRISQIIRRVEKWLNAAGDPTFDLRPSTFDSTAGREQLKSRLQHELLTTVARQAMRHFHE